MSGDLCIRLGVIGDVHCEDARLEASIQTLQEAGSDVIVQVGDLTDGNGNLDRCVELLEAHRVLAVAGNHERWFLAGSMRSLPAATLEVSGAARAFLSSLPPTRRLRTPKGDVLVCHGVGEDDMFNLRPTTRGYDLQPVMPSLRPLLLDEELAFMVCGHTHQRMVRHFDGLCVINAGTLVEHGPAGFVLADFDVGEVRCWDFDGSDPVEATSEAIW